MIVGFLIGLVAAAAAVAGLVVWLAFQPPSRWWPPR